MTFKDGEKYFGIDFSAYDFSGFACMAGIRYMYDNGVIVIADEDIPSAIAKGLEIFAVRTAIPNYDQMTLCGIRSISKNLVILMAALINKDHNLNISNEEPCQ